VLYLPSETLRADEEEKSRRPEADDRRSLFGGARRGTVTGVATDGFVLDRTLQPVVA
jgi:hypothetical protein